VADANPNTIVVLETGNPVTMPWQDKVRAIVEAWYSGQAGGPAIAEILTGSVNPSGRLPLTLWDAETRIRAVRWESLPSADAVPVLVDRPSVRRPAGCSRLW
jgi:hypothetical protein